MGARREAAFLNRVSQEGRRGLPEGGKGRSYVAIWKSIPGRHTSRCKRHKAGVYLACRRTAGKPVWMQ